MNRRGFMKVLFGCSAGVALPVIGKAVSNKPVIVVDPAKPGSDHTEMMICRYEGVTFIETKDYGVPRRKGLDYPQAIKSTVFLESTPSGENVFYSKMQNPNSWNNDSWDAWDFQQEKEYFVDLKTREYTSKLRNVIKAYASKA